MKISQREARRLRKRVTELEQAEMARRRKWNTQWIGVEIVRAKWEPNDAVPMALRTANRLSHAVVAIADADGTVRFVGLPHPDAKV